MLWCSGCVARRIAHPRSFSSAHIFRNRPRPTTAPKQIPDLKSIRTNPDLYKENTILRNYAHHKDSPEQIAGLITQSLRLAHDAVEPRRQLKSLERELVAQQAKADKNGIADLIEKIKPVRRQVNELDGQRKAGDEQARLLALALPNLTSSDTPTDDNYTVLSYLNYDENNPPTYPAGADHAEIGQELGILDFVSAATTTGWGFYYLLDEAAMLEQALIQYALATAKRYGWGLVTPPSLVYSHIGDSCGFQPRDKNSEQQIWQIAQGQSDSSKPSRSLAATAEIPLAALYAGKEIPEQKLPLKVVGASRCYRAEAGARGVDTKGLYRVHEFSKVEMFAWANTTADDDWIAASRQVFDEMLEIQKDILSSLGLPCRILEMPTSDLGASAYRKIDIEALFPSRMQRHEGWGELSSVSMCTDYQSRRLGTRIKERNGSVTKFPHTLNGTALAVPRVLAAILEHGWQPQTGTVKIPDVLVPYTGFDSIGRK